MRARLHEGSAGKKRTVQWKDIPHCRNNSLVCWTAARITNRYWRNSAGGLWRKYQLSTCNLYCVQAPQRTNLLSQSVPAERSHQRNAWENETLCDHNEQTLYIAWRHTNAAKTSSVIVISVCDQVFLQHSSIFLSFSSLKYRFALKTPANIVTEFTVSMKV